MAIDTVVQRAAGLDIAKASLVVCIRTPDAEGGWQITKRKFTTMTADLLVLADWLGEHGITRVGMESTADYWRPVFHLLEHRFDCWLLNARHMRAVPGRKTDMTDAEWICDLVAHGLVRASFVPPAPIRRLRDLTRRRAILLAERTREKQRMEKLLEDAGVKLSVVATDIFGKSGRAILDALIAGERDGQVLAGLALGRLRTKIPTLTDALVGHFDDHHGFLASMICHHIDTINDMVTALDARIDTEIEPYRPAVELLILGRRLPRQQQDRRKEQTSPHPPRRPLAQSRPRHRRDGRHPHEELLRPRPVPTRRRPPGRQTCPSRRRPQPARRCLARPDHQHQLPRSRWRLLHHPRQPRTPSPPRTAPTPAPRLPRHPRTRGGLTASRPVIFESTRDILSPHRPVALCRWR